MPVMIGEDVPMTMNSAENTMADAPRKSANSRDIKLCSTGTFGISFIRAKNRPNPIPAKRKSPASNSQYTHMPGSTNEWTEVSPSTPLRVRNVEYNTITKQKMLRTKFVLMKLPLRRWESIV